MIAPGPKPSKMDDNGRAVPLEDADEVLKQNVDQRRQTIRDYIANRRKLREETGGSVPYFRNMLNTLEFGEYRIKWTPYIPHLPTAKQLLALMLGRYREVFYGGAAGGGKSDWLLMEALQYVDVPGYAAVIFRRTMTASKQSGGIYDRFIAWMNAYCEAHPDDQASWPRMSKDTCIFPSGATITFAYLDHDNDLEQYQSAEFQFVGFDELTHFPEHRYLYLFSRMRRLAGSTVPVRIRSASNPGGRGAIWVKNRWKIQYDPKADIHRGFHPDRPMVPAFAWDNVHLDVDDYIGSLLELDAVTREQLLRGNWNVAKSGRFQSKWFRRYSTRADYVILGPQQRGEAYDIRKSCRMFQTVDPAASLRDSPDADLLFRNKAASWSVIATWLIVANRHLLLWKIRRFQVEIPYVIQTIQAEYRWFVEQYKLRPEFISIESNGSNLGVYQGCVHLGLPVKPYSPHAGDKVTRSTDFSLRAEQGMVWLPEHNSPQAGGWLDDYESEMFNWIGHPDEQDDQVDASSQAGSIVNSTFAPFSRHEPGMGGVTLTPGMSGHMRT